jgi:hypothetical protein
MKDNDTIIAATLMVVAIIEIRIIKEEKAFFFADISRFVIKMDRFNTLISDCVKIQIITHSALTKDIDLELAFFQFS